MRPWYSAEVKETAAFFDVDVKSGLSQQNVLARIKKFGLNNDPATPSAIQKVYKSTVLRNGHSEVINPHNLVPGDIVIVKEGDRVPADLRLFKVKNLKIDQSSLTGEALPATKNTFARKIKSSLDKQKCIAFCGTFVNSGSGSGIVINQAHSSHHSKILSTRRAKPKILDKLQNNRLNRAGIVVQNFGAGRKLNNINLLLFNMNLTDQEIQDLVIKIQLSKKIPCKFIVNSNRVAKLNSTNDELKVFDGNLAAKLNNKQKVDNIIDSQLIVNIVATDTIKLLNTLANLSYNVMYVTEGLYRDLAINSAYLSLIVGDHARGDNLAAANLIAPKSKASVAGRILYNKK